MAENQDNSSKRKNSRRKTAPSPRDEIDSRDAAEYIRAMTIPMVQLARDHNLEVVAYLLKLASEESGLHCSNIAINSAPRSQRGSSADRNRRGA